MDLTKINEVIREEGIWMTPVLPDGSECDFAFLVVGRNSEDYRRALHKNALKLSSNRKKDIQEAVGSPDMFVACVKDWRGITDEGKEYPCTRENKEKMYNNPRLRWLTEQIEAWAVDDSIFLSVKE